MSKEYTVKEVFDMLGEQNLTLNFVGRSDKAREIIVDGYKVRTRSLRYMTFYQKGLTCACCGRVGTHFKLDGDGDVRRHFNLYCDDGMLMTKDHIMPKSLGGSDSIDNLQPMCAECNFKKGNTFSGDPFRERVKRTKNNGDVKYYDSFEAAVVSILNGRKINKSIRIAKAIIDITDELREAIKTGRDYRDAKWELVKGEER